MGLPGRLRRIRKPSQKEFVFGVNKVTSPKNPPPTLQKGSTTNDQVKTIDGSKSSNGIRSKDESVRDIIEVALSSKNTNTSKARQNNESTTKNSRNASRSSRADNSHSKTTNYPNKTQSPINLRSQKSKPTTSMVNQTPSHTNTPLISSFFKKKTSASPSKKTKLIMSPKSKTMLSLELQLTPTKPGTKSNTAKNDTTKPTEVENLESFPDDNGLRSQHLQKVATPTKRTPSKLLSVSPKKSLNRDTLWSIKNVETGLGKITPKESIKFVSVENVTNSKLDNAETILTPANSQGISSKASSNKNSSWHAKNAISKEALQKEHSKSANSESFSDNDISQPFKQTESISNSPMQTPIKYPTSSQPVINSARKNYSLRKRSPLHAAILQNKSEKRITKMQSGDLDLSNSKENNEMRGNVERKESYDIKSNGIMKIQANNKRSLNEDVLQNRSFDLELSNSKGNNDLHDNIAQKESDDEIYLTQSKGIIENANKKRSLNEDVLQNDKDDKVLNLKTKSKRIKKTQLNRGKQPPRKRKVKHTIKKRGINDTSDLEAIFQVMANVKDNMSDNLGDKMCETLEIYFMLVQREMIKAIDNVDKYINNEENIQRIVKENKTIDTEIQKVKDNLLLQRQMEIDYMKKAAQNERDLIGDFLKTF